ncbi:hypothetical protein GCM10022289_19210 [Pedobacter jeongneungensis]|uniref:Uncharacterized protein n=1 Tax=Pedobacter jeongneungensis TaxID=947309 RepID=A0ABP8BC75_9SPHI
MLFNSIDDQARALQKIFNELGIKTDPAAVSKRIQELNNGLAHEDEFIYILNWLKNTTLIHKLDQFQIPESTTETLRVPDLLVLHEKDGEKSNYLIEVKTSQDIRLSWTPKYYNGLKNYSERLGVPMLIAWKMKKFNTWTLFKLEDFIQFQKGGNFKMELGDAYKRNLMSSLFGDYFIALPEEFSLVTKNKKLEKCVGENGEMKWKTFLDSVYFNGRDNKRVEMGNVGVFALLFCLQIEEAQQEDKNFIYHKSTPLPNKTIFAQSVPAILSEVWSTEKRSWLEKIQQKSYQIDYETLLKDLKQAIGEGTVNELLFTQPYYQ